MAGKRIRKSRAAVKSRSVWPAVAAILLTALAAGAAVLFLMGRSSAEEEPPSLKLIPYNGGYVSVIEGIPVNTYDPEAFSQGEDGLLCYASSTAMTGIDVSSHQGEIDWEAVAGTGVEFAIIRAGYRGYTEGALFPDSRFEENIQGALGAGLRVGVYFFSQAVTPEEAEEEADFLLEAVDGYDLTLPVLFDWEWIPHDQARTDGLDRDTLTQCALAFCGRVADRGYEAGVYFNQSQGYLDYDFQKISGYTLWLAEYGEVPTFYYDFRLWQYTDSGSLPGISEPVDLNICFR